MKDVTGREIKVGNVIAYPTRRGATMKSVLGVVRCIDEGKRLLVDRIVVHTKNIIVDGILVEEHSTKKLKTVTLPASSAERAVITSLTKIQFFKSHSNLGKIEIIRYKERD